jgi:probable rRNA maturation factor
MILLDPELEPDPAAKSGSPLRGSVRAKAGKTARPKTSGIDVPTAETLARFLKTAQDAVRLRGHVTVLLTTDAAIRKLNKQFRGKNKATDVLSFPADTLIQNQERGDLAISVETARKQADEQGHGLAAELRILMLHGLLHLAGYDHETDDGRMARQEMKLRAKLGLPQGLIERAGTPESSARDEALETSTVRAKRKAKAGRR